MLELDIIVCSTSGKPVFRNKVSTLTTTSSFVDDNVSTSSFTSSLQGLLSFVTCTQHEELLELDAAGCHCVFRTVNSLTFAAIERDVPEDNRRTWSFTSECLEHLLRLLQNHILLVLSDRGLDVLKRQPRYDLRELLNGTDRVTRSLTELWAVAPTLRFKDCGVPFVQLKLERRREVTRALEFEAPAREIQALTMICGLLLAKEQVVAIAQPNKKQFSMLVDGLVLLINFVYHMPSLATSETWTPICLSNLNARGFLYAYVVFLTTDVCLLLLSSDLSPEQFPHFQTKKEFVVQLLEEIGAMDAIDASVKNHSKWQPHSDLPLLQHFIYKNELTGECAEPDLAFPFDNEDFGTRLELLNKYATVHDLMSPTSADPQIRESQVMGRRLSSLKKPLRRVPCTSGATWVSLWACAVLTIGCWCGLTPSRPFLMLANKFK